MRPTDSQAALTCRTANNRCQLLIRNYELKREQKVIESNNTGSFFNFVNKKLTCKKGVGVLRDEQGNTVSSDEQRANMWNKYFSSVCTEDNGTSPSIDRAVPDGVFIDNIAFTPFKVAMAIKRLKAGKSSTWPRRLPTILI